MTKIAMLALGMLLTISTGAMAERLDPYAIKQNGKYNEYGTKYPVTGFRGLPWFVHGTDLKNKANQSNRYRMLNKWASDHGVSLEGDTGKPHTEYTYTTVVGANAPLEARNMWAGTFSFKPDATYGVGQHASWEIYIVISGKATFYNYDKEVMAEPGTWIMMRPFDPHGIKNASKTEPLELAWFWWKEDENRPNWDTGGLPFQPKELWLGKGLHPQLKPTNLPKEPTGNDRYKYMYADD